MNVRHLSFRLLQVYLEVVRLGNISAAARLLHLTQPTVSLQLKKLADTVGEPLLEQRDGALCTTLVGAELFQAAADVLGRFDDFNHFLTQARSGETGQISIGIVTTAKYILPGILGAFYRKYPKVNVTLNIGNRAHILNRFAHQQDDLYLFSHPPAGPQVKTMRILKNPLQLIAPRDHWAAKFVGSQQQLQFSQLQQERFLLREPGSATRLMFESWLNTQGKQLSNSMQIESNEAIRLSVAAGLGLSVISEHTLAQGHEPVSVLPVAGFPLDSHWYLVSRADRRLPYAAKKLVLLLADELSQHNQAPYQAQWVAADIQILASQFIQAD